jgi:hypothetical protein
MIEPLKSIRCIRAEVAPSTGREDAEKQAVSLARKAEVPVFFEFNGETNMVFPDGYVSDNPALKHLQIR